MVRAMSTAFVGETRLPKNFKRYARQFSLLELDCEPGSIPGKARLAAVAEAAPEGFVFSLVVPSRLASLESGPDVEASWKAAQSAARLLGAKWWVVRTPAEVRPTRRSREALGALVRRLGEGGMRVAWEPRGVWDENAAADTAAAIGAAFVQDIAREVPRPGSVLYSRLLAVGKGARIGLSLADLIAERVRGYDEAFIVVEGQGARDIQQALGLANEDDGLDDLLPLGAGAALAGVAAGAAAVDDQVEDDEEDDADEDEDEDEDEGDDFEDDDEDLDDEEDDDLDDEENEDEEP
jgi:uncharacterized protein YecE (DUF72 family)